MKLFYEEDQITLLQGNVEEVLYEMAAGSIQCVVTSPPYYALRDYGVEGQIGLEESLPAYLERMVEVFRGLRHVLRDDGTVWLNIGDTYAGGGNYNGNTEESLSPKQKSNRGSQGDLAIGRDGGVLSRNPGLGIKNKELMGVPWRLAFALQADGWYLRRDVIWEKPNPMPESCRDRPTTAHEYVFMLTKRPSYFFDQIAVKEPHHPDGRQKTTISGSNPGVSAHENYAAREGKDRWPEGGRNIRSVWEIPTQPMPEAHFATFPEKLVEPCVKASTSEKGCCPYCSTPWRRIIEEGSGGAFHDHSDDLQVGQRSNSDMRGENFYKNFVPPKTIGWEPGCECVAIPDELVEKCVAASTSEEGCCSDCGAPWERIVEKQKPPASVFTKRNAPEDGLVYSGSVHEGEWKGHGQKLQNWLDAHPPKTVGWKPTCECVAIPEALVDNCVALSTSEVGACGDCGSPWRRVTETSYANPGNRSTNGPRSKERKHETSGFNQRLEKVVRTLGWEPTCECLPAPKPVPCKVLDPFVGSGTVPLVARRLGRHGIGIDLNPQYLKIAEKRVSQWYKRPSRKRQTETVGQMGLLG